MFRRYIVQPAWRTAGLAAQAGSAAVRALYTQILLPCSAVMARAATTAGSAASTTVAWLYTRMLLPLCSAVRNSVVWLARHVVAAVSSAARVVSSVAACVHARLFVPECSVIRDVVHCLVTWAIYGAELLLRGAKHAAECTLQGSLWVWARTVEYIMVPAWTVCQQLAAAFGAAVHSFWYVWKQMVYDFASATQRLCAVLAHGAQWVWTRTMEYIVAPAWAVCLHHVVTPTLSACQSAGTWCGRTVHAFGQAVFRVGEDAFHVAKSLVYAACYAIVRVLRWLWLSAARPLAMPAMALVTSFEFAKHGAIHWAGSTGDHGPAPFNALCFAFASIVSGAVGLVLSGRVCRGKAEMLRREVTRRDGLHQVCNSVLCTCMCSAFTLCPDAAQPSFFCGRMHLFGSHVLESIASVLERVGVFAYCHADLGTLDALGWLHAKVNPAIVRAGGQLSNLLRTFVMGVWNGCVTLISSVGNAIWAATKALASGAKALISYVAAGVFGVVYRIWSNPFSGLLASGAVFASAYRVHTAYPDFSLHAESARLLLKTQHTAAETLTTARSLGRSLCAPILARGARTVDMYATKAGGARAVVQLASVNAVEGWSVFCSLRCDAQPQQPIPDPAENQHCTAVSKL